MSHDFELRRLTDRLKTLSEEQKRINARILQSRRDEQFDLDHIRRKYSMVIQQLEERQRQLNKELEKRERELESLQKRIREEEASGDDDDTHPGFSYANHLRRV